MNCNPSFKLKNTDYLYWIGKFQNRQAEQDLIDWASQEVLKILLEPDIPSAIIQGKFGVSHAILTALALYGAEDFESEADKQLSYWYNREAKARQDKNILNWNSDSQMDFLVPLIVVKYFRENLDTIKTWSLD